MIYTFLTMCKAYGVLIFTPSVLTFLIDFHYNDIHLVIELENTFLNEMLLRVVSRVVFWIGDTSNIQLQNKKRKGKDINPLW